MAALTLLRHIICRPRTLRWITSESGSETTQSSMRIALVLCIELQLTVFLSPLYIVLLRMVTKLSQIPDQELPRRTGRKRMKRPPTAEDNVGEPDEEEESDHHDDAPGVADSASLKQHLHLATLGEEQRRQRPEVRVLKRVCQFDSIKEDLGFRKIYVNKKETCCPYSRG